MSIQASECHFIIDTLHIEDSHIQASSAELIVELSIVEVLSLEEWLQVDAVSWTDLMLADIAGKMASVTKKTRATERSIGQICTRGREEEFPG